MTCEHVVTSLLVLLCVLAPGRGINLDDTPWEVLLRARAGTPAPSGMSLFELWAGGAFSPSARGLRTTSPDVTNTFKSALVETAWQQFPVIKFSLYTKNKEVHSLRFNNFGATKFNWFSPERVMGSSFSDILLLNHSHFSLAGMQGRSFYVSFIDSECRYSKGWMMVRDVGSGPGCRLRSVSSQRRPQFLYTPYSYHTYNSLFQSADVLVIAGQRRLTGTGCENVPRDSRLPCDKTIFGVGREACENAGCCYEVTYRDRRGDTPTCFRKQDNRNCPDSQTGRAVCNDANDVITALECARLGCCWRDGGCYIKTVSTNGRCQVNPQLRKQCAYEGITSQHCVNQGCCYASTADPNIPNCFHKGDPTAPPPTADPAVTAVATTMYQQGDCAAGTLVVVQLATLLGLAILMIIILLVYICISRARHTPPPPAKRTTPVMMRHHSMSNDYEVKDKQDNAHNDVYQAGRAPPGGWRRGEAVTGTAWRPKDGSPQAVKKPFRRGRVYEVQQGAENSYEDDVSHYSLGRLRRPRLEGQYSIERDPKERLPEIPEAPPEAYEDAPIPRTHKPYQNESRVGGVLVTSPEATYEEINPKLEGQGRGTPRSTPRGTPRSTPRMRPKPLPAITAQDVDIDKVNSVDELRISAGDSQSPTSPKEQTWGRQPSIVV